MPLVSKPTTIPRWATAGSVIEPTEGKKDVGWQTEEQPPGEYMNWLSNLNGLWADWLNDLEATDGHTWASALIWAKTHTFNLFQKIKALTTGSRTKVLEFGDDSVANSPKIRVFVLASVATFKIEIVGGADWNGANWVPDNTVSAHTQWRFTLQGVSASGGAFMRYETTAAVANFADGTWTQRFNMGSDGALTTSGTVQAGAAVILNGAAGDTNPAADTTAVPTNFKLLWRIAGGAGTYTTRLYALSTGGLALVLGAAWNGANWVRDSATYTPIRYNFWIGGIEMLYATSGAAGSTFADSVFSGGTNGRMTLQPSQVEKTDILGDGNIESAGPVTQYAATAIKATANGDVLLAATNYRHQFPSTPGSVTLSNLAASVNLTAIPTVTNSGVFGCTVTALANAAGVASFAQIINAT